MPQLVEPSDVRVYLGEVAVFECRLSNPPQEGAFNPNDDVIVIEWTKNDRPLASAGGSNSRIKVWSLSQFFSMVFVKKKTTIFTMIHDVNVKSQQNRIESY